MIRLRKVDLSNVWDITRLNVRDDQQSFVASNSYSIIEAFASRESGHAALPFGLYDDDTLVGFVMFGYDYMDGDPEIARGNYLICRFMIDQRYQGKGLGKAALQACLRYLRTWPCGPATHCWLSYEKENTVAKAMYHEAGFRENGETSGEEIVAVCPL